MPWRDTSAMKITRIEWFQVLMRADDLSFTMNLKTLKTVEYFFLEMILKIHLCWILTKLPWFYSHFIVRPTIINRFLLVFQYKYVQKIPNIWILKIVFQSHLQQKVLDGFQCFFIHSKAEIVSSHEHLKSFNSTDSSLRYHPNYEESRICKKLCRFCVY